jgi:hypothetical protein
MTRVSSTFTYALPPFGGGGRVLNGLLVAPAVCVLLALVTVCPLTAEPEQSELVRLASVYVDRFIDGFANVVAEERYIQESERPKRRRALRSHLVIVRNPGGTQWHTFREVLEADGKPVDEARGGRLVALFEDPSEDALRRAREITVASARYNVENIGTVNNPLLAMSFLQGEYRDRFRFTVGGRERKLGPTVRKVSFEETRIPTILTQEGNRDLPAYGVMWVEEGTGRIVKTEVRLGDKPSVSTGHVSSSLGWNPPTTIVTTFGFDKHLAVDVPVEMRDRYPFQRNEIKGVATYVAFRRLSRRSGSPPA